MSEDEANRMLYEARLKAWRDEQSRLQGALREGRKEVATKMKKRGTPINQIAEDTGLTAEEIATL
jgi:predicted transposase/invertase (TIGR01784 family)